MVVFEVNPCLLGKKQQCQQLIKILPQLKSVGVDVIYLMPIFKKGLEKAVGSPYCIADFEALEECWGNDQDWEEMRLVCDQLELPIWMDWVMNHTAWDHPWLRDFPAHYLLTEHGDFQHPLNTTWEDVVQLNLESASVLQYFIELAQKWMALGVQGFRLDASYKMPEAFLNQWIASIKLFNPKVKILVDRSDVFVRQQDCDGVMAQAYEGVQPEKFWEVFYGHDEAAFGNTGNDKLPIEWQSAFDDNTRNVVLSNAIWYPNERVSFFEARDWNQECFDRWVAQMQVRP